MIYHTEKGVSLIITFLVMVIMISIVLSLTTFLFNELKVVSNVGNSVPSFYAAEAGAEKTFYYDRKQIPPGATRGFCNICTSCSSTDCNNCTATPLSANGCSLTSCKQCEVTYSSTFDDKSYAVDARVTPNSANSVYSNFIVDSSGFFKSIMRSIRLSITTW